MEEQLGTSPPLELRRAVAGQRVTVPHSLQSPQDRTTGKNHFSNSNNLSVRNFEMGMLIKVSSDSPQVAQVYVPGTRIPHSHYPEVNARYYESARVAIPTPEPPPAHRNPLSATPPANFVPANDRSGKKKETSFTTLYFSLSNWFSYPLFILVLQREREREREREQREREQREKDRKAVIPAGNNSRKSSWDLNFVINVNMIFCLFVGHSNSPCPSAILSAMAAPAPGRPLQVIFSKCSKVFFVGILLTFHFQNKNLASASNYTSACQSSTTSGRFTIDAITAIPSYVARFISIENRSSGRANAFCIW